MSSARAAELVGQRARELLAARDGAAQLATITGRDPAFTMSDAYVVADELRRMRLARGERTLGYKIAVSYTHLTLPTKA